MDGSKSLWLETNKEKGHSRLIWLDLYVGPNQVINQNVVYDSYACAVSGCRPFIEMLNRQGKFASLISQRAQELDDVSCICIAHDAVLTDEDLDGLFRSDVGKEAAAIVSNENSKIKLELVQGVNRAVFDVLCDAVERDQIKLEDYDFKLLERKIPYANESLTFIQYHFFRTMGILTGSPFYRGFIQTYSFDYCFAEHNFEEVTRPTEKFKEWLKSTKRDEK